MVIEEPGKEPPPYGEAIVNQLAFYLQLMHGQGDFALTDDQALGLANAMCGVAKYHVKLSGSGKGMAYLALVGTCAMIYTPKLMQKAARDRALRASQSTAPDQMQ